MFDPLGSKQITAGRCIRQTYAFYSLKWDILTAVMLVIRMHDDRIENWSTAWQLKDEDDGEHMPNCVRGCGDRIEGKGG